MFCINSLSSCQLVVIAAFISIILSEDQTPDELNVLGNFIVAIGSLMLTIAAQEQTQKSKKDNLDSIQNINQQIEHLQKELQKLKSKPI